MALERDTNWFKQHQISFKNHQLVAYEPGRLCAFDISDSRFIIRYLPVGAAYDVELKERALKLLQSKIWSIHPTELRPMRSNDDSEWFVAQKVPQGTDPFRTGEVARGELVGAAVAVFYPYSFLERKDWYPTDYKKHHEEFLLHSIAIEDKFAGAGIGYVFGRLAFEKALIDKRFEKLAASKIWDRTGKAEKILQRVEKELEITINRA